MSTFNLAERGVRRDAAAHLSLLRAAAAASGARGSAARAPPRRRPRPRPRPPALAPARPRRRRRRRRARPGAPLAPASSSFPALDLSRLDGRTRRTTEPTRQTRCPARGATRMRAIGTGWARRACCRCAPPRPPRPARPEQKPELAVSGCQIGRAVAVQQGPKSDNSFRDFSSSFGTSQRSSIVSGGPRASACPALLHRDSHRNRACPQAALPMRSRCCPSRQRSTTFRPSSTTCSPARRLRPPPGG